MEQRPGDFDKYVDTVLKHFKAGEAAPIFDGIDLVNELTAEHKTERLIFMSFLLEEGLLRDTGIGGQKDNPNVRITPKGYMIAGLEGGWNEYIKHTKELEKLKNDLVSSSIQTNASLINSNSSLIETNRSIRKSNFIIPLILMVTLLATCGQIAVTWYTSETREYKLKTKKLEQILKDKDIQLKKLESEIQNLQLKGDSVSR
jgi:hypothetical protein